VEFVLDGTALLLVQLVLMEFLTSRTHSANPWMKGLLGSTGGGGGVGVAL